MESPILRFDPQGSPRPHSFAARPQVALEITRGRVQQRLRPITGKVFLIGAASDCDLVLGDLQFPEAYAYVFVNGSRVTIRRLGTGPELMVCGEPAETAEVFHGDLLVFGPFELRVRIDDAPRRLHEDSADDELAGDDSRPNHDERASAIDEVRVLLVDIRRCLADELPLLRLHPGSMDRIPSDYFASRRATA